MGGVIVVAYLARRGASPFDFSRVANDLPSFLENNVQLERALLMA
jgi:hypothetical protein